MAWICWAICSRLGGGAAEVADVGLRHGRRVQLLGSCRVGRVERRNHLSVVTGGVDDRVRGVGGSDPGRGGQRHCRAANRNAQFAQRHPHVWTPSPVNAPLLRRENLPSGCRPSDEITRPRERACNATDTEAYPGAETLRRSARWSWCSPLAKRGPRAGSETVSLKSVFRQARQMVDLYLQRLVSVTESFTGRGRTRRCELNSSPH